MMRYLLGATAIAAVLAMAPGANAQDERRFDIGAGPLDQVLPRFAEQSGQQILYPATLVSGRRSPGVQGAMAPEAALVALLRETGLAYRRSRPDVFVVYDPAARAEAEDGEIRLDEVVVTGTLLRGVTDGPSPVVVVSRDQMDRDGRATVADALAALPQNFGGAANEAAVGSNGGDRTGTNNTYANGVNLRGLGADSTLVLINGRRIAGSGSKGDFADVSSVPTAAVQRIDVLLDGASALYGADAVGGVVNIVLRNDYDGAETRLRIGSAGDGATSDYQFGQTFGRRWSTGGIFGVYEYNEREALAASERRRAGDADLRSLGGSDRRIAYGNPGNIVVLDPATGGYRTTHAIPVGQNGVGLRPGDFLPGRVNLSNPREGVNVLPLQERHSAYLTADQSIGDHVTVSGDLRWGQRRYEQPASPISSILSVTRANPYFASPTGAASHSIAYSFAGQLPNPRTEGEVKTLAGTFGAKADLWNDWRLDGYVAYAREQNAQDGSGYLQSTYLREALGAVADNPATPFSVAVNGYFNPFGAGAVNNADILAFISSGWTASRGQTRVASANLQLDGTILTLPGGPLLLAAGLSFRQERFERQASSFTSGLTPVLGVPIQQRRDVAALFAEARVPIFGDANQRSGFRRLELSLAARLEDYGDIGQKTSPKVGVLWEPGTGLIVRANYGRSFRAPALRELHDAASASPSILPNGSQQVLSMVLYGGNPDLTPEEADTWTAGVEYRPAKIPGLRVALNGFRIDFENRIGQPAFESALTALTDPTLSPFVRRLNPTTNADDRAAMQAILDLPTTLLRDMFPATSYGAIVDARFVNTASVAVRGADVSAGYGFDVGSNAFDASLSLTWLERFDAQATPAAPVVPQLDRPNFPVGLRGRASLRWTRGDWSVSGALNYVDAYRDLSGRTIDAWATTDVQVHYAPASKAWHGVALALTVQNAFDDDPPFYDAPQGVAYDAANANVIGRYLALQITKAW